MKRTLSTCLALGLFAASFSLPAAAQESEGLEITKYRIDSNDCFECGPSPIIQSADDLRVEEAKEFKSKGLNTKEFKEAQSNYIKGFRDYKKGQYERAISSFHACLSLYPKHLLCQRYQKLSYKKHEELIQYNMMLGKKYFDQGQYQACRSTFRNAMIMISDRSSKVYKEATANYKLCRLKTEGQY